MYHVTTTMYLSIVQKKIKNQKKIKSRKINDKKRKLK